MRTYDYKLILIKKTSFSDLIGNQIESEEGNTVLCCLRSVNRSEFYSASINELRPEKVFLVHGFEYDGQKEVEFEGIRYTVIRTYSISNEELELTCERKVKDV